MRDEYQMRMLAGAERDGKPVHDLLVMCKSCWGMGYHSLIGAGITHYSGCEKCGGSRVPPFATRESDIPQVQIGTGYIPNTGLGALIAACIQQGFDVTFHQTEMITIRMGNTPSDVVHASNPIDALFQATETLKPDNWGECPGIEWAKAGPIDDGDMVFCHPAAAAHGLDIETIPVCPICHGTSWVIIPA